MPICVIERARGRSRSQSQRPAATAALTLALLTAIGCSRPTGPKVPDLPPLRPAELLTSARPLASYSDGALGAAREVVRRYYAALDDLRRRMRTAPLRRLLTADCPCQAQVRAIRTAIRHGERYTDRIRMISLVAHRDRDDLIDVVVSFDVSQAGLVDAGARRLNQSAGVQNAHREVLLRRIGDRWLIEEVMAV